MGELVWKRSDGEEFQSELKGMRVVVRRSATSTGFQYLLFERGGVTVTPPIASGSREHLAEAFEAAEGALRRVRI